MLISKGQGNNTLVKKWVKWERKI